jgi:hypothetical protein
LRNPDLQKNNGHENKDAFKKIFLRSLRRNPGKSIEILELEQVGWHRPCKYFLGERTPCKELADFYPRQGNLL